LATTHERVQDFKVKVMVVVDLLVSTKCGARQCGLVHIMLDC